MFCIQYQFKFQCTLVASYPLSNFFLFEHFVRFDSHVLKQWNSLLGPRATFLLSKHWLWFVPAKKCSVSGPKTTEQHIWTHFCFVFNASDCVTRPVVVPLCVLWSGLWSRPRSFPRCLLWRLQPGRRTSCWRWCPDTMSLDTCHQMIEG